MTRCAQHTVLEGRRRPRGDALQCPARARQRHAPEGRQVLVVDDNEYVRLYIKKLISHVGLGCLMACDAQEALGLIARHSPFLAILDIEMPGMSGPELGWRIKCERPEIHIAAISGHYGTWEPDDLYDLGFERLFWKPLDREEFLKYCLQVDGEMALGHAVTK